MGEQAVAQRAEVGCIEVKEDRLLLRVNRRLACSSMMLDGRSVFACCALDALFLPELLGRTVKIESRSPASAEKVSLTVGPDGMREVSPAGAVLSFLHLDGPFDDNTRASFCHFVHFFASEEEATG